MIRNISVRGIETTIANLTQIGGSLSQEEFQPIINDAANLMRSAVEIGAPIASGGKHPGRLRRSIKMVPSLFSPSGRAQAVVFADYKTAPEARFTESGTRAHVILPKKGGSGFLVLFGKLFVKQVNHPGTRAMGWFKAAVSTKRDEVRLYIIARAKAVLMERWQARQRAADV